MRQPALGLEQTPASGRTAGIDAVSI